MILCEGLPSKLPSTHDYLHSLVTTLGVGFLYHYGVKKLTGERGPAVFRGGITVVASEFPWRPAERRLRPFSGEAAAVTTWWLSSNVSLPPSLGEAERLRLLKKIPNVIADTEEETVATSGVVKLQKDTKGEGAACVTTQTKEAKDVNVADVPSAIEKLERGADVVVESLIQEPADIELKFGEIDETSSPKKIDKAKEYDPMVLRSLKDQVINIDEDEESAPNVLQNDEASTEETCEVWHYIDPSGNEQGPFSLASLRYWKEEGFFKDDFKVWRSGEPRESAILLTNVLHLTSSS
ncbi:hypothetical protein J5N97_020134 [Dioscorea zingiberensis]|uniref:GYF domain-containing protein n=1 Tax=Dioscorea zingiberensis TaxID=325984 RepID=A0A9D5CHE6_9LILI|nr:hypothetical protein J5N97_020134 [Dioscorea zingiberensis]